MKAEKQTSQAPTESLNITRCPHAAFIKGIQTIALINECIAINIYMYCFVRFSGH